MKQRQLFSGSTRLENIVFSPVRKVLNRSKELEAAGRQIVHLEIGEPDFDTPQPIVKATIKSLGKDKLTHYGPNAGYDLLRDSIANKIYRDKGLVVDSSSEVLVTIGAAEAIFISIMALINPGDEVIILSPAFMNYVNCVELAGGIPVIIPLREENEFQIDPHELESRITVKTKMVVLNNPHNPTGMVYSKSILEEVSRILRNHGLMVLSDEIYDGIVYDDAEHFSMSSFPDLKELSIIVNGFSKTFAMTGWRLGYIIANERLISQFIKVHQYIATCAPTFLQAGVAEGMLNCEKEIVNMVAIFKRRRDILINGLHKIEALKCVKPRGAFYAFVNIKSLGITADKFADMLLEDKGVAVVPGTGFGQGGEGYFRISYATSDNFIRTGIKKITELVDELTSK